MVYSRPHKLCMLRFSSISIAILLRKHLTPRVCAHAECAHVCTRACVRGAGKGHGIIPLLALCIYVRGRKGH